MLPDLIRRGRTPTVGITASQASITLRIAAEGDSEEECQSLIQPVAATIRQCLGNLVYGADQEQLQDVVLRQLAAQGKTLATAECGTGARLADVLSRASATGLVNRGVYRGGVAGDESLPLVQALGQYVDAVAGIDPRQAITEALARGCRQQFQADSGLAIGPLPEVKPDAANPPPVFVALATPQDMVVRHWPLGVHPALVKIYFVKQALNMLRLLLLEQ